MDKKHNRLFESVPQVSDSEYYDKVVYKLLPGANKMLPHVFLSEKGKQLYQPSADLIKKYEQKTHIKGDTFNLTDCHNLIDFFKAAINKHPDWQHFNFKFSATKDYQDISGFYREVENQGYKLTFQPVAKSYIDKCVAEGKLFLFKIHNKDFSEHSKGTPNMHTLYWRELFSEQNLADVIYKLNGSAEVFYRRASIKPNQQIVHQSGYKVAKKTFNGQKVDDKIVLELNQYYMGTLEFAKLSEQAKLYIDNYALFDGSDNRNKLTLVKDRRFTQDKFQFHVPITLNFKASGAEKIDLIAREYLQKAENTHIIGIDRGERHLLYVSVINPQGEIVEQFSLNQIINEYHGQKYKTDYHNLLDKKEKDRGQQRQEWQTIENIKELKEGYLSQVVHQISKLMIKYNAIIVMEDLNSGFKNSRLKVEKQVYQKFEKMLIEKLSYLAFKNPEPNEPGIRNALQLSSRFDGFNNLKQSGFIFYVPAWNTSKIDPVTGFVDFLKPKYTNLTNAQEFFSKFDSIKFNQDKDWFEFSFNYKNFTTKANDTRLEWTICTTNEDRYSWNKSSNNNKGGYEKIEVSRRLKALFDSQQIPYATGQNFKEHLSKCSNVGLYKTLIWLLNVTLQMRYCNGNDDYLLSPIADSAGNFFDSRKQKELVSNDSNRQAKLPIDSDANGAYNIARKGLWVIKQLKRCENIKSVKLAISNKEWLQLVQA